MTPVFALAFDHRNSFRRDFMRLGGAGVPTPAQHAAMVAAKAIVVDALLAAMPEIDAGTAVLLIDHEYGGELVPKAQAGGVLVALPVEESGRAELRYLDDDHPERVIGAYHPDYVKVLIRYNPGGDAIMNGRQRARLRDLAKILEGGREQLMLELLVPPEAAQLATIDNDRLRFDRELRAALTAAAVREIAEDGVRPGLWKIEGPESPEDAALVAGAVRAADPDAACLVLGRGADYAAVRRWLALAAATDGFAGFAVGRTLWWDALRRYLDDGDREAAVRTVAARYLELVGDYLAAVPTT
jgi:myo-inositol catabolism protein IolC